MKGCEEALAFEQPYSVPLGGGEKKVLWLSECEAWDHAVSHLDGGKNSLLANLERWEFTPSWLVRLKGSKDNEAK